MAINRIQIKESKEGALLKIREALSILQKAEKDFNDTLTDDNGCSLEREYNSIFNAIQSLYTAKKELIQNI